MEAQAGPSDNELRSYLEDAFEHVEWRELRPIVDELAAKSARFRARLENPATVRELTTEQVQPLLSEIFVVRRHREEFDRLMRRGILPVAIGQLLHDDATVGQRITAFLRQIEVTDEGLGLDLATELLHFTLPDRYWLWSRWLYDPTARTGVLPLLLGGDGDLRRSSLADGYLAIGRATMLVSQVEDTRWLFTGGLTDEPALYPFAADVFLAAAWGSYLYGVTAWRLTREFHKVLPPLPRLVRRLFGLRGQGQLHETDDWQRLVPI